jgi:hypothetical protein
MVANPGADVYGSDLQMLETVSALKGAGWRAVVALPGDGAGPLRERLAERGAEVLAWRFPVVRRSALTPAGFGRLAGTATRDQFGIVRLLRRVRPDVVLVNTNTIPWWISAAKLARVPVVCHVHEAEDSDRRAVLVGLNAPMLLADRLMVNSRTAQEAALSVLPALRSRIRLVYNGVPDRPTPVVPVPAAALPFRLAVVSRLSPRKGVDVAVRALEIVRAQGRDVRLEIAGSPFPGYEWYEEELRALASTPVNDGAVTFTGYVNPVWPVLDRAHAAVFPSLREPFGNALVEAQLAGRPVIASAAAGHLETVEDGVTGLHVRVSDAEATAAAVIRLMDDPALAATLAENARRSAIERFSIERYGHDVLNVLEEVMHR